MYQRDSKPWLTGRYIRIWPHLSENSIVWSYIWFLSTVSLFLHLQCFVLCVSDGLLSSPLRQFLCLHILSIYVSRKTALVCLHLANVMYVFTWKSEERWPLMHPLSLSQQEICFYRDISLLITGVSCSLVSWFCLAKFLEVHHAWAMPRPCKDVRFRCLQACKSPWQG